MQVADASRFGAHGHRMTRLTIRTVNSQFATETMLDQIETAEQAQAIGVSGAIAMLAEEVAKGISAATVTVRVYDGDHALSYAAVSVSVAPLCLD